ncbi:gamma-glutamylcyclotransferase [Cupriavidus sp. D39]|uniref:gamma-glutamylcyclotransferase n=1 Tax=Cupriavidus sp. D39 TaxID=2997877 RepID=UPI00226F563B|nr:gamma-glutamylcyclotransferase [Cupriavidus sp. D39]MCY0852478.1 gamma-glutamylcyclotransferase [Cupriavidus sp. D39]
MYTRETIHSGAWLGSLALPKALIWTQAQIDASLAATMRARPPGEDIWVFAYGSLMWNPLLNFDRREVATLQGWRRSFCIRMVAGRGSSEVPGRMLALEQGGTAQGVALRLTAAHLEDDLRVLWVREMIAGSYVPTWASLELADGSQVTGIVFVANTTGIQYERDASVESIASIVAGATGAFGSNAEYVHKLERALSDCGLTDEYIADLANVLRQKSNGTAP